MLGKVGGHLEGAVHGHIESELSGNGRSDFGIVARSEGRQVEFEDSGSVVHRATLKACEGEYRGVCFVVAAHCLIFRAARAFVADEVGVGAGETVGRQASWALTMILCFAASFTAWR